VRTVTRLDSSVELPPADLRPDVYAFAWDAADLSIRAVGAVPGFVVDSHAAYLHARERVVGEAPPGLPMFVGGRSFSRQVGAHEWEGWPAAAWWLPSHMVVARGAERWSIRHELRAGDASVWSGPELDMSLSPIPAARAVVLTPVEPILAWNASIRAALAEIDRGGLQKVVVARRVLAESDGPLSPLQAWRALGVRAGQVRYAVALPGRGAFVGATPESLFRQAGSQLFTEAIAGTAPAAAAGALLESSKNRREHDFVVQALTFALAPWTLEFQAAPARIKLVGPLCHLHTAMDAVLRTPGHFIDWVDRLHPTPAVAGWPREPALAFIAQHEAAGRGWYAGALGWTDGLTVGHAVVALRCGLFRGAETRLYAGAGIVAGSRAEEEWAETDLKLGRLAAALSGEA
jgi:isochorismate synthase